MKLTTRQKYLASCVNPYYKGFSTPKEVREAKELAKGKFWYDSDNMEYWAVSLTGRRYGFGHNFIFKPLTKKNQKRNQECKEIVRKAARLWIKNKYQEAIDMANSQP